MRISYENVGLKFIAHLKYLDEDKLIFEVTNEVNKTWTKSAWIEIIKNIDSCLIQLGTNNMVISICRGHC